MHDDRKLVHESYAMYGKWGVGPEPGIPLPEEADTGMSKQTFQDYAMGELAHPDQPELDTPADQLVRWRMGDPRFKTRAQLKRDKMQRQFTIDVRCDFTDANKNADMEKTLAQVARHLLATATLLSDGQKPTVAVYSDDAFLGHKAIELLDDSIVKGQAELGDDFVKQDQISQELIDACRDTGKPDTEE